MILSKEEAIMRLCALTTVVNEKKYGYTEYADCFCGDNNLKGHDLKISSEVIEFIEQTVYDKLQGKTELQSKDHEAFFNALDNPVEFNERLQEVVPYPKKDNLQRDIEDLMKTVEELDSQLCEVSMIRTIFQGEIEHLQKKLGEL